MKTGKRKTGSFAAVLMLCGALLLSGCGAKAGGSAKAGDSDRAGDNTTASAGVDETAGTRDRILADAREVYHAEIEVKEYGTITVALVADAAPATVENFLKLAREGFYDGLTFHRIIDGFMIQGGDPNGNGTGGSDQTIVGEFASNGHDNPISHMEGVISMARAQDPDSASSQFFITVADSAFLDGQYAAFGYVTEGMDIAKQIAQDAKPIDGNGTIPADAQPVITAIRILEDGTSAE